MATAEELDHEELLWEDQSWAFPNLGNTEKDKSTDHISYSEAAKDEAVPPPSAKVKKRRGAASGEPEDHELHIWTERERRKKMRNMFSNLHALLPHIPPKADKSTIVDEAVNYIKKLEQNVDELEKQKMERYYNGDNKLLTVQPREAFVAEQGSWSNLGVALASPNPVLMGPAYQPIFKTWTSPNVILNICGRDGHINVCSMKKPGLLAAVCFVMDKHNLEVVSAQASSDLSRCMYMIHARQANGGSDDQFQQVFPIEETFKQAAAEIMLWVTS